MSNQVEICNLALAAIRAGSINDINETSLEAQQCRLHFDMARKFILRATNWAFTTKSVALQLLSTDPLQWVYAYSYPLDCLKIHSVTGDFSYKHATDDGLADRARFIDDYTEYDLNVPYEIHKDSTGTKERSILTDQKDAYAIFTHDTIDVSLFDDTLVTCFYFYLASLIAVPIVGADLGRKMREDTLKLYSFTLSTAIATNMNERRLIKRSQPKMIRARS